MQALTIRTTNGFQRRMRMRSLGVALGATVLAVGTGCSGDDGTAGTEGTVVAAVPVDPTITTAPATTNAAVTTVGSSAATPTVESSRQSTTTEPIDLPLTLLPDGLGIVTFQQPYTDVVDALRAVLGEPDVVGQDVFEPAIGSMRSVTWGHLRVDFTGGASQLYFSGYLLAREMQVEEIDGAYRFTLPEWTPAPWELQLTTQAGVGLGTTVTDAAAVYPTVYAARCNAEVEQTTLVVEDGTTDQLFVNPAQQGVYLQRPIDATVWAIGAQASPNPLLCDGAMD